MKTHRFLALGLAFAAVTTLQAQQYHDSSTSESDQATASIQGLNFERIKVNYLSCLHSDVPGVVESALGHVTYMRIAFPNLDLKEIEQRIVVLTMEGYTRPIRAKAFQALRVFADPASFHQAIASRRASGDGLFEDIAARIDR